MDPQKTPYGQPQSQYGDPQVHYAPPQDQHNQATVSPVTVIPGVAVAASQGPYLGTEPQPYTCDSCRQPIVTEVRHKPSVKTHLFALCLCCIGFVFCFWIPYCINSCKNVDHYCPNCQSYIGTHGDHKLINTS